MTTRRADPEKEEARSRFHDASPPQATSPFEIICEIEAATKPNFDVIHEQVATMAEVASSFLVPDNHLGRATISSLAVAREISLAGAQPIVCLNSRDRNRLGFQRDLLTAAAYGIERLLLVYGDRGPADLPSGLNVQRMLEELRGFGASSRFDGHRFRVGVTTRLTPVPSWKLEADSLFVQASFNPQALLDWRAATKFDGPVYAGVIVLTSEQMAKGLMAATGQIVVPPDLLRRLRQNPMAGVDVACELIAQIKGSRAFDGVHLTPVTRSREVAARLRSKDGPAR